jgi:hypothetical protein
MPNKIEITGIHFTMKGMCHSLSLEEAKTLFNELKRVLFPDPVIPQFSSNWVEGNAMLNKDGSPTVLSNIKY